MNTRTCLEYDCQAKKLTQEYLKTEGELLSLLIEMKQSGAILELGYQGIYDYCQGALKLSNAQSFYFKSVAQASEKTPELKIAVTNGEISLSQARRIAPVVNHQNLEHWIDLAKTLPQIELEREVNVANPNAKKVIEKIKPIEKNFSCLTVMVGKEAEMTLRRLKDILSQKLGKAATLGEVVEWAAGIAKQKFDPEAKAERCAKREEKIATAPEPVQRSNNPKGGPRNDGGISSGNGRRVVPQRIKHQIVRREAFQCGFRSVNGVRCQTKRWLHLHHIQEVARGGANTPENLIFLCSTHHRWTHRATG